MTVSLWSHPGQIQSCQVPSVPWHEARVVCLWSETGEKPIDLALSFFFPEVVLLHFNTVCLRRFTNTPIWPSTLFTAFRHSKSISDCVFFSLSVCLPYSAHRSVTRQQNALGLALCTQFTDVSPIYLFLLPLCGNAFKFKFGFVLCIQPDLFLAFHPSMSAYFPTVLCL